MEEKEDLHEKEETIKEQKTVDSIDEGELNTKLIQKTDPLSFEPILSSFICSDENINANIEKARQIYHSKSKPYRIVDIISLVISFLVIVGALITLALNTKESFVLQIVLLVVFAVVLVSSFVINRIFSKKKAKLMEIYLKEYENILYGTTFHYLNVTDAKMALKGNIDEQSVIRAHYYSTIEKIESRAAFEATRNGYKFTGAELAVIVPIISVNEANKLPTEYLDLDGNKVNIDVKQVEEEAPKRNNSILFSRKGNDVRDIFTGVVGRFFSYGFFVDSNESFIITFRGQVRNTVLPSYVSGFHPIHIDSLNENILVYAVDPVKVKHFFDEKAIKLLNNIQINDDVLFGFISCNSYGTNVAMSLSDNIMFLPMKDVTNLKSFTNYIEGCRNMFKYVDYVEEKDRLKIEKKEANNKKESKVKFGTHIERKTSKGTNEKKSSRSK